MSFSFKTRESEEREANEYEIPNKAQVARKLYNSNSRRWMEAHGRQLPPPPLSSLIEDMIKEWFELVDDDGSCTLDPKELEAALKAAHIPCTHASIREMLDMMDFSRDGLIDWKEFHSFISYAVHEGQDLLNGDLVLPSGLALPLGLMIHKLRRRKVMQGVFKGGAKREDARYHAKKYVDTMQMMMNDTKEENPVAIPRSHSCSARMLSINNKSLSTMGRETSERSLRSHFSVSESDNDNESCLASGHALGSVPSVKSFMMGETQAENGVGHKAEAIEEDEQDEAVPFSQSQKRASFIKQLDTPEMRSLEQKLAQIRKVQWNVRGSGGGRQSSIFSAEDNEVHGNYSMKDVNCGVSRLDKVHLPSITPSQQNTGSTGRALELSRGLFRIRSSRSLNNKSSNLQLLARSSSLANMLPAPLRLPPVNLTSFGSSLTP